MGEMSQLNKDGDLKIIWDAAKPDEVASAKEQFDRLMAKGYWAYSVVGKNYEKGEQIREFDPQAQRIILAPRLQGG